MPSVLKEFDARGFKDFDSHKLLVRFEDPSVKLKGFIAIHNDNLGSATGGTRMFPYKSEDEAIADVLRLSRAMTYKCALAGVRHGGGKAVIIGDPDRDKSEVLLRAYARVVNELAGRFTTGEDVGMSEDDVQVMLEESKFFIGRRGVAGDPSPFAALSTFTAIKTATIELFGSEEVKNRRIAVKGVGKVGSELVRLLYESGAEIVISDIKASARETIKKRFPHLIVVAPEAIHRQLVDVFAPCALGNDVTKETIGDFHMRIICGGANNQLSSKEIGDELFKRRIFYVPDYVANAGGLINVVDELEPGGYSRERVLHRIEQLKNTLATIYLLARQRNRSLARIADELAEEIFKNGKEG
jgi:leucine dehydrogenase